MSCVSAGGGSGEGKPERQQGQRLVLDLRGLPSPEPYMKALNAFSKLQKGQELVFITDSLRCAVMFTAAVQRTGLGRILEAKEEKGVYTIRVVKT